MGELQDLSTLDLSAERWRVFERAAVRMLNKKSSLWIPCGTGKIGSADNPSPHRASACVERKKETANDPAILVIRTQPSPSRDSHSDSQSRQRWQRTLHGNP